MEIPLAIINEAFILQKKAKVNPTLRKITRKLERYSVEELLFEIESHKTLSSLDRRLYPIFTTDGNDQHEIAGLIKVAHIYLDRFFTTGDLKCLVIFVYCNCYLKVDNNKFGAGKRRFKGKNKLVNNLQELIQKFKIKIELVPDAGYYERKLTQHAKVGFVENDLKKVYDFVLATERGGRGFHFNYLVENLLYFYFQFDRNAFIKQINRLSDPVTIVFYFQSFPRQALLTLLGHPRLTNSWVIFEIIRLLTDRPDKKNQYNKRDIKTVGQSLNILYLHNRNFYIKAIDFLHRSTLFNLALGDQMVNLNDEDITALFSTWLPFSKYDHTLEARNFLLKQMALRLTSDQYKIALNAAFNRWKTLYDEILFNDEEYINNLFQTDFANFVIHFYSEGQEQPLVKEIKILLTRLAWIDSEWSPNASHQIKIFNLYFSYFFLLSYAYNNKNLNVIEVEDLLTQLIENAILSKHIANKAYFTNLAIARNNILPLYVEI
ncbi:hypothetical protein DYU05_05560 [Mucilaginibacter terrenus]|uniref:Uncharacterized protein n=1 Tax=Mucilaginibacter terrenus TaxID=2482727 RepID=A0A3E2NVT1_9SPHI|nr:hypothetical protein [Mucilaginibacter terrenus]RFZ85069.1 hypothetical protein DYU05_05560 [Mucilaginibacter terrenus]